ncbi:MAG: 2-oxoacid:ferredoxin oxidoreductase subunit beta [Phycisphaerales bacterium]|nr:2-oxoacid:ferredoxin oxidoreductase subunit beta [Phycisphaerales bacterium]
MSAPLTLKDFKSDQEVRWCPGCGDYAILSAMQKALADLGVSRENTVFVSGIGCSSRFPYYMNTYGFHSIHGRAPAVATGVKCANPELDVWVITGDGDGLSIGLGQLVHAIRRNLDFKIILFNNRIYGLTKGQYSPTSETGKVTKSTPDGSLDQPLNPLTVALASGATFVARCVDADVKHMQEVIARAAAHRGTAFVEVYQDCNVYNHHAFEYATDKKQRPDHLLYLEHGKPMVFGAGSDRGIRLDGLRPVVEKLDNGNQDGLLKHDESVHDPTLAMFLARMKHPEFPEPVGVLRAVSAPTYERRLMAQVQAAVEKRGNGDLDDLFNSGDVWDAK